MVGLLAIVSLMLACLGVPYAGIPGIAAIILGIMTLRAQGGRRLAVAGISMGTASVVCWGIILSHLAPSIDRRFDSSSEISTIHQIRTIYCAETEYAAKSGRFADRLEDLGAAAVRNGYRFTLTITPTGYVVHADPLEYQKTGRRCFFSDQTMVIHQNWGAEAATAESPELR
jgi:hypothetical protein